MQSQKLVQAATGKGGLLKLMFVSSALFCQNRPHVEVADRKFAFGGFTCGMFYLSRTRFDSTG
jgi:hypothetical protein